MDILLWLQKWYESNCDGYWEHHWGITIETLDNPGWKIDISLRGTAVEHKSFQKVDWRLESDCDWLCCNVSDAVFHGQCGPHHLLAVLELFKRWVEE